MRLKILNSDGMSEIPDSSNHFNDIMGTSYLYSAPSKHSSALLNRGEGLITFL